MGAILWTRFPDDGVSLGDPFYLFAMLAEMAEVTHSDKGWKELYSIPQFVDGEDVDPTWLRNVYRQAEKFQKQFKSRLSGDSRAVLDLVVEELRSELGRTPPE